MFEGEDIIPLIILVAAGSAVVAAGSAVAENKVYAYHVIAIGNQHPL